MYVVVRAAGWCSCLVVLLVFVKKLSCCFLFMRLALVALCGIMLRYRSEVGGIKSKVVFYYFFIGVFVCQGGDTQKAHNVYYV